MSTIGSRIHDRRVELGFSVDELAARLGKNRATVYRYESAEIENFHISVIEPLATALQTTPAYLMGWTEDKEIPGTETDAGVRELIEIVRALSPENRAKLVELARLYLSAQHKTEES